MLIIINQHQLLRVVVLINASVILLITFVIFCEDKASILSLVIYDLIISSIAFFVPKISANTPKIKTNKFFQAIQLNLPNPTSQNVIISMKTGIINPKMQKQKAPIRATNGAILGTAIAKTTAANTIIVLIK